MRSSLNKALAVEEDRADEAVSAEEQVQRLRDLLLSDEHQDLKGLKLRIEALERSTLVASNRRSLGAAPQTAPEADDPDRLVAALQPQLGRLLSGGLGHALRALGHRTNRTIDALMSWRITKLRLKAAITGQSLGELVESELRLTEVRRVYFMVRRAGVLLFHWSNKDFVGEPSEETVEEVLTTAHMLTEFVPEHQDVPLRSISLSHTQIVLQASARHVVAIEIASGTMTDSRKEIVSFACREMLDDAADHRATDEDSLEAVAMRGFGLPLVARQKAKQDRRGNPAYVLGLLLLLGGVSWYGWRANDYMQIRRVATAMEKVVLRSFRPGDVVVDVVPDRANGRIAVTGMGFGPGGPGKIGQRLNAMAGPYTLDFNLVVRDLDGAQLERDALAASLSDAQGELGAARAELKKMGAMMTAPAPVAAPDAQEALRAWTRDYAIFFDGETAFRDPEMAGRQIADLARLMVAAPQARLRIEGYTTGDNRLPDNAQTANARALTVADALLAAGIGASRLIPLAGHRADPAISTDTGPASPNHRVEFSLAFRGE